ncbi:MAG: response regulator transcription factor [Paludibacteraceae bacterium]|nr:response regulator transcription factor [Paludibacteraceae bacterium]
MEKIKLLLVDDHKLFRNGLKILLENTGEFEVIGESGSGSEFLEQLKTLHPDVVMLDIEMPDINGIEATKRAIAIQPDLKIISLSMYEQDEYHYKMINAGAKGFLVKDTETAEVAKAIKLVHNGETYFSSDILLNVVKNINKTKKEDEIKYSLSTREKEVLEQICNGLSNQEIADTLFISRRTVEKHRSNLLEKTNCKNTANLVMFTINNNLLDNN